MLYIYYVYLHIYIYIYIYMTYISFIYIYIYIYYIYIIHVPRRHYDFYVLEQASLLACIIEITHLNESDPLEILPNVTC